MIGFRVRDAGERLMILPEIRVASEIDAPCEQDQKSREREGCRRITRPAQRFGGGFGRLFLRGGENGKENRRDEDDDRERHQPAAYHLVDGQREEIKAERLVENRIEGRSRRLIQIKREFAPAV